MSGVRWQISMNTTCIWLTVVKGRPCKFVMSTCIATAGRSGLSQTLNCHCAHLMMTMTDHWCSIDGAAVLHHGICHQSAESSSIYACGLSDGECIKKEAQFGHITAAPRVCCTFQWWFILVEGCRENDQTQANHTPDFNKSSISLSETNFHSYEAPGFTSYGFEVLEARHILHYQH